MTAAEIVPANSAALQPLDPASREVAVTQYLVHARDQLALAVHATGPEAIAALKAEFATAAEATRQLGLSKEIQTDVQEMVRRAEYALGKAIRGGQERGEIEGESEAKSRAARIARGVNQVDNNPLVPRARFASTEEWSGNGAGIGHLSDGVTEPQFEAALDDAKSEGNLSRANVVRKVKGVKSEGLTPVEKLVKIRELAPTGRTSGQIGTEVGCSENHVRHLARKNDITITADKVMNKTRRLDHTRFVNETVTALEALASGLDVLNLEQVDPTRLEDWATSLTDSLKKLSGLARRIKEMTRE